jgi:hypothetical protein
MIDRPNRCSAGKNHPFLRGCGRRLKEEVLSGTVAQLVEQTVGVLSRFVVANKMDAEVKQAFRLRPHLVDNAAGFVWMVLSPEDMPSKIWLMTYSDGYCQRSKESIRSREMGYRRKRCLCVRSRWVRSLSDSAFDSPNEPKSTRRRCSRNSISSSQQLLNRGIRCRTRSK